MRRLTVLMAVLGLTAVLAAPVSGELDPHPHMLLQRPEIGMIEGVPHLIGVRKCVDLAGNRSVPLHAHHEHLHFGESGVSFGGASGHVVIPASHFPTEQDPLPWSDCESFLAVLPLDISEDE